MDRKKRNSDALRGRANPKASKTNEVDHLSTFFAYSRMGLHTLAMSVLRQEEIEIHTVMSVIKEFLEYHFEQNPKTLKGRAFVNELFQEAEAQARNHDYGPMLANLFLIWAQINDPNITESLKKELRMGQSKGGKTSHWRRHVGIIQKHLGLYKKNTHKTKSEAISAIEKESGVSPLSPSTFDSWWKKYNKGIPLYLAATD